MAKRRLSLLLLMLTVPALLVSGCGGREEGGGAEAQDGGGAVTSARAVGTVEGMFPPPFTLPDLDGEMVSLSDFEGKVVVLDLWATWCPPCRKEIPFLVSLYDELEDQGLVVVGVGLDEGGASALGPFVEQNGISYPILVGDRTVQAAYGVTAIPTTFMIGRDGRVAVKHVGFDPSMAEQMRSEIERLLTNAAEEA